MGNKTTPLKTSIWAEAIFQYIPTKDERNWISGKDLGDRAGLDTRQVRYAIGYLRDHYPEFPLISSVHGYQFTIDNAEIEKFQRMRATSAHTTMSRLWKGVVKPYVELSTDARFARVTSRQFERILEDIGDLVGITELQSAY